MNKEDYNNLVSFDRCYRSAEYEVWSAINSLALWRCGDAKIVIKFAHNMPTKVTLFTNSKKHIRNEQFYESVVALFESLTQGEGTFAYREFYLIGNFEYTATELISFSEIFITSDWDDEKNLVSVRKTEVCTEYEHWKFLWSNMEYGVYSEDHVIIEKKNDVIKATVFTMDSRKVTSAIFIDQICGLLSIYDNYAIYFVLCDEDPYDLAVEDELEMTKSSKLLFSNKHNEGFCDLAE